MMNRCVGILIALSVFLIGCKESTSPDTEQRINAYPPLTEVQYVLNGDGYSNKHFKIDERYLLLTYAYYDSSHGKIHAGARDVERILTFDFQLTGSDTGKYEFVLPDMICSIEVLGYENRYLMKSGSISIDSLNWEEKFLTGRFHGAFFKTMNYEDTLTASGSFTIVHKEIPSIP